jgi:hypothetical protein
MADGDARFGSTFFAQVWCARAQRSWRACEQALAAHREDVPGGGRHTWRRLPGLARNQSASVGGAARRSADGQVRLERQDGERRYGANRSDSDGLHVEKVA